MPPVRIYHNLIKYKQQQQQEYYIISGTANVKSGWYFEPDSEGESEQNATIIINTQNNGNN